MTLLRSDLHPPSRLAPAVLYVCAGLLIAALVGASTGGAVVALVAMGAAAFIVILVTIGAERTALLVLVGAYFTAPFYKGLAFGAAAVVTVPDLLLLAGFALLLPRLVHGHVRLPPAYAAGVALVLVAGLTASVFSAKSGESFVALGFWMIVMLGLPVAFALWGPLGRYIDLLAASFVAGQVFSLVMGVIQGKEAQGRHAGLSTHPNYLAQAGVLSICLLLYLSHRHMSRSLLVTTALSSAGIACVTSIFMSGSRAGTVVLAVLVLLVPVVERSAIAGFLIAAVGALFLFALPAIIELAGDGSVFSRLGGDKSAEYSNSARSLGLDAGIARFFEHPLRGTGLVNLFDIHNNFVEVAVGIGVFGLAGYLLVLYAFARPLVGHGEFRRLSYVAVGYIGFGATVPSLYDRSVWAVMALSAVAMVLSARNDLRTETSRPPIPLSRTSDPATLARSEARTTPVLTLP